MASNFWGILWIDASSQELAKQGFIQIARDYALKEDLNFVKRWFSNVEDHWLLVLDNADDLFMDISQYFPTGNRGSILLKTCNPDCKIHATAGS